MLGAIVPLLLLFRMLSLVVPSVVALPSSGDVFCDLHLAQRVISGCAILTPREVRRPWDRAVLNAQRFQRFDGPRRDSFEDLSRVSHRGRDARERLTKHDSVAEEARAQHQLRLKRRRYARQLPGEEVDVLEEERPMS